MLPLQRLTQLNLVKNAETFNITDYSRFAFSRSCQWTLLDQLDHLAAMSSRFFTTGMRR